MALTLALYALSLGESPALANYLTQGVSTWFGLAITNGTGPYTVSAVGLPPGLSLSTTHEQNTSVGSGGVVFAITGTPTILGTYNPTFNATDSLSNTGSISVEGYIGTPLIVQASQGVNASSPSVLAQTLCIIPPAIVGVPYSFTFDATWLNAWFTGSGSNPPHTADPPYTITGLGFNVNPGGMSITAGPGTTCTLSGTPTTGTFSSSSGSSHGNNQVFFSVSGNSGAEGAIDVNANFHVYISSPTSPPTITCGNPPNGSVFVPYAHNFDSSTSGGTPPYTFSVLSGALPTGVTLNTSSGIISGTPTAVGTFTFAIEVTDATSVTANTGTCSITIGRPAMVNAGGGGGGGPSQSNQPTEPGLYEQLCTTSLTVDAARKRVPTLGSLLKMSSMNQFAQPQVRASRKSNQFVDCDVTLVYNYQIGAFATIVGLQQPISAEGDFYLCAIQASSVIQQRPDLQEYTGNVSIRIADDVGYRLMDDYITMNFLTEMGGNPWPFVIKPAHFFRAGTKIWIDMQENSGFLSNVQVSFRGRYRYRAVGGGR